MTRIIAGLPGSEPPAGEGERRGGYEWGILAALGGAFTLVSLLDIALTFYPLQLGSAEWEFGTATAVMNNLPLAVVGLGLVAVAGLGRRVPALVNVATIVAALLIVLVLILAVMFGRNLGQAMSSVTDPLLRQGLQESIIRTAVQLVAYLAALGWLVASARRS